MGLVCFSKRVPLTRFAREFLEGYGFRAPNMSDNLPVVVLTFAYHYALDGYRSQCGKILPQARRIESYTWNPGMLTQRLPHAFAKEDVKG